MACAPLSPTAISRVPERLPARSAAGPRPIRSMSAQGTASRPVSARSSRISAATTSSAPMPACRAWRRVESLTDEDWDFNFDVNARGVFLTNQLAIRHFLAAGRPGRNRQHRLAGRQGRRPLSGALLGQQVRRDRLHPGAGARGGGQGHPRELRLPRLRQNRHAGAGDRVGGGAPRHHPRSRRSPNMSRRPRSGAWRSPRTSPRSCCSSPPTWRASSPVKRSTSPAA